MGESVTMTKELWILQSLIMVGSYMVLAREPTWVQEMKSEVGMTTTMSPPEGNSTFIGRTTWCVAGSGATQEDLQSALDWACGSGHTDCGPIRKGGHCFEPETILSHASYAFNSYYQQNGNNAIACNFGGTAIITKKDPSYGKCVYAASEDVKSSAAPLMKNKSSMLWWTKSFILLLFYIRY